MIHYVENNKIVKFHIYINIRIFKRELEKSFVFYNVVLF